MLRSWLAMEHIKAHWQESDDEQELRQKFLVELPERFVYPFVISHQGTEIGYIQYYDAARVGGGWWESEPNGTFGIDLLIGNPKLIGKGFGPAIINDFISFLKTREPAATSIIIDPAPSNARAIRAFEKAGFRPEGEIATPGGKALLMRFALA